MAVPVSSLLYQKWEDLPLARVKAILMVLPTVQWGKKDDELNTFAKNFVLKQCFKSWKTWKIVTAEQRVDLFTYELDFLQKLTHHFPLKSLKQEGIIFHAPYDALINLSLERLAEADTKLSRYLISENSDYMNGFLACLYQPFKMEFTAENIQINGKILSKIPDTHKVSIIRSYLGSRKLILVNNPELFSGESESTPKGKVFRKVQDTGPMWEALIFELANKPAYQGIDNAKKANAWEALAYMNRELSKSNRSQERP